MPVVFFLRPYRAIFGKEHLPILSSLPSNLIRLSSFFPQPSAIFPLPSAHGLTMPANATSPVPTVWRSTIWPRRFVHSLTKSGLRSLRRIVSGSLSFPLPSALFHLPSAINHQPSPAPKTHLFHIFFSHFCYFLHLFSTFFHIFLA